MRRSHSKGALFNDEVFEVPILRSPARKNVYRAPTIGVQGVVGSEARAIPVLHHSREVSVVDKLLGRHFVFNITSTHTFESLKTRIQSRQGQEGLRIIPAHIQCLTYKGVECPDTDEVLLSLSLSLPPPLWLPRPLSHSTNSLPTIRALL